MMRQIYESIRLLHQVECPHPDIPMARPVVKSYCSSLSLSVLLPFDTMGAWRPVSLGHMMENKAICTQEWTAPIPREYASPTRGERT